MEILDLPFVQRGMLEIAVLAVGAGLLGTWIVLRGLAFFAHAVGTAAFPGLVLADGLGFAPIAGAFGSALLVVAAIGLIGRRGREDTGSATALVLVGALAAGVLLASDVFGSGGRVDRLLFGSLLAIGTEDVVLAAAASLAALAGTLALGARWLSVGFDETTARAQGVRAARFDAVLLALVAFTAVASLSAVGALLTTALLVVPAATTRLLFDRLGTWQAATVGLVLVEGLAGLWVSVELNAPPGATIAVLAAAVFALAAAARAVAQWRAAAAVAGVALLALLAAGCGGAAGGASGKPDVVASTTQLGDLARAVGGDAVAVRQLLKPNSDPHEYEPRPDDVRAVAVADVVLRSGMGLDDFATKIAKESGGSAPVVDVSARLPVKRAGGHHHAGEGDLDPHWWHDPRNVEAATRAVRDALTKADPGARATFARNADAYAAKVAALDRAVAACFARVPAQRRKLVTDHDAFGYFADRYGIHIVGAVIPSLSTQAQPSAGELAHLAATVEREHVRAVFPESSLSPRLAQAIARRTGASADHTLYADTLGPAGSRGATWLGAHAANADAVVQGFTGGSQRCDTPAS